MNSPGHLTAAWAGDKKCFLGPTLNLTEHIFVVEHDIISTIGKKFVNRQGLPYMPQIW